MWSDSIATSPPDPNAGPLHQAFGARPVAFWVPEPGARMPSDGELEAGLRDRLAGYKVPVAFFRLAALPRTASGKIRRVDLRAMS